MSLIDFAKSINSENVPDLILGAFDELMVLYQFVGTRQDIKISHTAADDCNNIEFTFLLGTIDNAKKICESLNFQGFTVFNKKFIIEMTQSKSSALVRISVDE